MVPLRIGHGVDAIRLAPAEAGPSWALLFPGLQQAAVRSVPAVTALAVVCQDLDERAVAGLDPA